jgi:3D (Asp-Asp-Asp) domain-containing protein/LysM repeat protein
MRRRKRTGRVSEGFSCLLAIMFMVPSITHAQTVSPQDKSFQMINYTVEPGDSLYKLSETFQTTVSLIAELNHVSPSSVLHPGQTLKIVPRCNSAHAATYVVKPGDTIWEIAQKFHTTIQQIVTQDQHESAGVLQPGTTVYALLNASGVEKKEVIPTVASTMPTLSEGPPLVYSKSFVCKLTAYGPGFQSTGKHPWDPGYGITASGQVAKENETIAVDPDVIPLGSLVYIEGLGYRKAEDTGGAIKGNHIDVFFSDDNKALEFGVKEGVKVYLVK